MRRHRRPKLACGQKDSLRPREVGGIGPSALVEQGMQHEMGNRKMAAPRFHQFTPLGDNSRSLVQRPSFSCCLSLDVTCQWKQPLRGEINCCETLRTALTSP